MKKLSLIFILFIMFLVPLFAVVTPPPDSILTLDFTAGLIANLGFSSRSVSSMVYPSDSILSAPLEFEFNSSTGYFETDTFYVFCQVFSQDVKVSLKGTKLTSGSYSLDWVNTTSDIVLSIDNNGTFSYENVDVTPDTIPDVNCYELKLRIDEIPEDINWTGEYSGSLTITITSTGAGGETT